jgi:hypothetical protein
MVKVIISYSDADKDWKNRLETQLLGLALPDAWSESRIAREQDWRASLAQSVSTAEAAILLISAAYLASPFLATEEIPHLFAQRACEGMRVIPLHIAPCAWQEQGWLSALPAQQALNDRDLIGQTQYLSELIQEIRALSIRKAALGPEPALAAPLLELADLLLAAKSPEEAKSLTNQALAMAKLGADPLAEAMALKQLSHVLQKANRLAEAECLLRQSLVILLSSIRAHGTPPPPHLQENFHNYFELLQTLFPHEDALLERLTELWPEAGYRADDFMQWLEHHG